MECYTVKDAHRIQKRQYTKAQYHELKDRPEGYSPEQMLMILRDRCRYLIERGSTLNNPHIPRGYFDGWPRISSDHAVRLRRLVRDAGYPRAADTDRAT